MELRQVRFFVAVAEDRHFGRAAQRMYIAQPALSQHVRRLELELGVRLFDRSGRRVRLTPAGEAFLVIAQRLLSQADEAARRARLAQEGVTGTISIGVEPGATLGVVPAALRCWGASRPDVRPVLASGRRAELLDRVWRGEIDVAVLRGPVSDVALASEVLLEHDPVVLLPSGHPLCAHEVLEVARLRDEPFVVVDRTVEPGVHDRTIAMCDAAGFSPRVVAEVDTPALVPLLVASHLGVAVVPQDETVSGVLRDVEVRRLGGAGPIASLVAARAADGATRQAIEFVEVLAGAARAAAGGPPVAPSAR